MENITKECELMETKYVDELDKFINKSDVSANTSYDGTLPKQKLTLPTITLPEFAGDIISR